MTLTENVKFNRVAPDDQATTTYSLSAGTSDVNSVAQDSFGFTGATFLIVLGALTANMTIGLKIQGSADGSTGWTDITSAAYTGTADTDDSKIVLLEANNLDYRYVRVAFDRATANAVIDALIVAFSNPGLTPVSQGSLVETAVAVGQ